MKPGEIEQLETLRCVLDAGWIKDWSIAVDGGAYVGNWTASMRTCFDKVIAFEPHPESAKRFRERHGADPSVVLYEKALFDRPCRTILEHPGKRTARTSTYVRRDDNGTVEAIALDSLNLASCGLLKLDLEGAEYDALVGAAETINRCRPVLIVEMERFGRRFGHSQDETRQLIAGMDYRPVMERYPDCVFVPR